MSAPFTSSLVEVKRETVAGFVTQPGEKDQERSADPRANSEGVARMFSMDPSSPIDPAEAEIAAMRARSRQQREDARDEAETIRSLGALR